MRFALIKSTASKSPSSSSIGVLLRKLSSKHLYERWHTTNRRLAFNRHFYCRSTVTANGNVATATPIIRKSESIHKLSSLGLDHTPTYQHCDTNIDKQQYRVFSNTSTATKTASAATEKAEDVDDILERKPSVLSTYKAEHNFTYLKPGTILHLLQIHYSTPKDNIPLSTLNTTQQLNDNNPDKSNNNNEKKKQPNKLLRQHDVKQLFESCRPNVKKDAVIVRTALCDFKRCYSFILGTTYAELAMRAMKRSLATPHPDMNVDLLSEEQRVVAGRKQLEAGMFVGNAVVDTKTGLFVSATTKIIEDVVMETLLNGLSILQQSLKSQPTAADDDDDKNDEGDGVTINVNNDDSEEGNGNGDGDEEVNSNDFENITEKTTIADPTNLAAREVISKNRVEITQLVSNIITNVLIERASTPTERMGKKSKRKYLKMRKCCEGPSDQSMTLAVNILLNLLLKDVKMEEDNGSENIEMEEEEEEGSTNKSILEVAKNTIAEFEKKTYLGTLDVTTLQQRIREAEQQFVS